MSRHIIYAISKIGIMAAIIMACLFAPSAYAQDTVKLSEEITIVEETPVLNSGNTAWLIVATILVLLMSIPGIALFYGGLVRQKNILSIIMQTLLIVGVVSILWVAFGKCSQDKCRRDDGEHTLEHDECQFGNIPGC